MNRWEEQRQAFLPVLADYVRERLKAPLPKNTLVHKIKVVVKMARYEGWEKAFDTNNLQCLYCGVEYQYEGKDAVSYDWAIMVDGMRNNIDMMCLFWFINKAIKAHKGVVHDTKNEEPFTLL